MFADFVHNFNAKYIKKQPKAYLLLESKTALDKTALQSQFGPVIELNLKEIFGY